MTSTQSLYDGAEWDVIPGEDDDIDMSHQAATYVDLEEDNVPAYRIPILLPSSLGSSEISRRGLDSILAKELELRRGQAEDQLAALRVTLAWKSVLFRRGVRLATGYSERTRAWQKIASTAGMVRLQASAYELTRRTLYEILPEDSADGIKIRERYKKLTQADLKISTEFLASDIRGNRHTLQSWIWNADIDGDIEDEGLMHECE